MKAKQKKMYIKLVETYVPSEFSEQKDKALAEIKSSRDLTEMSTWVIGIIDGCMAVKYDFLQNKAEDEDGIASGLTMVGLTSIDYARQPIKAELFTRSNRNNHIVRLKSTDESIPVNKVALEEAWKLGITWSYKQKFRDFDGCGVRAVKHIEAIDRGASCMISNQGAPTLKNKSHHDFVAKMTKTYGPFGGQTEEETC
jgi:hypothetical protein